MEQDRTLPTSATPGTWAEELQAITLDDDVRAFALDLAKSAPASYRERTTPEQAALDAAELSTLLTVGSSPSDTSGSETTAGSHRFTVRPLGSDHARFHIRRLATRPVELTALLPRVESFGLVVEESVPYRFEIRPGVAVCIDDLWVHLERENDAAGEGVSVGATDSSHGGTHEGVHGGVQDGDRGGAAPLFDVTIDGPRLLSALDAVVSGSRDADALNGLVVSARLDWREASLLRAYTSYWAQCAPSIPPEDIEDSLLACPDVARALVAYFGARFDPAQSDAEDAALSTCEAELSRVSAFRRDRALRVVLALVGATVRTNFYQRSAGGEPRETIALKLESASVPNLPLPHPMVETWVYAPYVEAVHLRAGAIARGGIRWSERPNDFRTEILGLMVAQVKKNAVIVPTGAKGGFVCRGVERPTRADIERCYSTFITAILDVTDDLEGGKVVGPREVVCHDGPDPYLVVAADKGTGELSDLANQLSAARGYWLGDAFASGGSHGFNHKTMGITSRGAWVAVRRHFHQLGIDVQNDPVTVAGVGDMSGDVFGNAMLLSHSIRLVAAFDHRHVFLDPDPDPITSYDERQRLALLSRSSWADYSSDAISEGGGVWSRESKEIVLSPQARSALGTDRERLSPPELITVILEAPVDLLWFGGIGTYIRAVDETDADVGDRANDEVRITAGRVRARVIGEGANLGVTQRGRIRYSRRGGRINTDFIDNAAGVATSDREVNLKILLALAAEEHRLDASDRDGYLQRSENEVATEIIRQVDHSVAALNRAVPDSAGQLEAYASLIEVLGSAGRFDRTVESLPDAAELSARREAGAGMIRPELAVLLAYTKYDLVAAVERAPFIGDPSLAVSVQSYFPSPMRADFGDLVAKHRLYDQIAATEISGEVVDQLGIVWAHETSAELGTQLANTAGAYWAARQVVGAGTLWGELDSAWAEISADADAHLHHLLSDALTDLARCYLRQNDTIHVGALISADAPIADSLSAEPPPEGAVAELTALGVDGALASRCLTARTRSLAGDIGPVVRATKRPVGEVRAAFDLVDEVVGAARMRTTLREAPTPDRWRTWLARATLDDLADWRRQTVTDALSAGATPEDAVRAWTSRNEIAVGAARQLLSALDTKGADPLSVVAVALRRLPWPS